MPEYLTPGVYVEEIERGPRPIEGVPTSTAAFLGETERGPLRPRLVTSYNEYRRWFGGVFAPDLFMPQAVNGFFENGGKRLYVTRIVGKKATPASHDFGDFTVTAVGPGASGKNIWVKVKNGSTVDKNKQTGFRLQIAYWSTKPATPYDPFDATKRNEMPRPQLVEDWDDLSADPTSSDYFDKRLKDSSTGQSTSALVKIERTKNTNATTNPTYGDSFLDQNGAADPGPLSSADFAGTAANPGADATGLEALKLDSFRDVALVYAPYPHDDQKATAGKIVEHCELQRFRFGVIDGAREDDPSTLDPRTVYAIDSSYVAFYAPWLLISDPETGAPIKVPPGGHALGVYANTDITRGVFKAPANEVVRGALGLRFDINDETQGALNPKGVNAIRQFAGRGIRIWGGRTLSSNSLWKYVSVRRLFIFLEHSIYDGTQWVVFEPNDERLWARVKDSLRLFLRTQWREGALMGTTEDQAFFITCDRTTMTQDDILNGRLICEIGIAPVRPAEFVVFRIFQQTAEAQR